MTSIVESTKPGVTAIINAGRVASPIAQQPTSTFFVVGYSPWGPAGVPRTVTSWLDYVRQFGGHDVNSYLDDALYAFFNLFRGKQAVVCRVVGANPVKATLSLKDRSADAGINTLRVDAKYPSTRVDIKVKIENGTVDDTFKLTLTSVLLDRSEIFDNLTIDADVIAKVNQDSQLVDLTDLASATVAPDDIPRAIAATALAGGDDKFSSLAASDYIGAAGPPKTGLFAFDDEIFGTGQIAIPGLSTDAVHAALIAHAEAYHRLALLDPPLGSDKDDVADIRANYGSSYAAIYWPWVKEPAFDGGGLNKFYPPSGFAAGACAQVDRTIGVHKAPANISVPGAIDVERFSNGQAQVDDNTREFLNGKDVNVISPLPNEGIKIYGARVITDQNRRVSFVHEIRLLNELYYAGKLGLQWAVFQVVDGNGRLFRDIRTASESFLRPFYQAGALYGAKESDAFMVVCDDSNNPPDELAEGRVHCQWSVRISPTSEMIILNIDNVPLIQDLSVLQ
jgi:phage tail sheath protein FI